MCFHYLKSAKSICNFEFLSCLWFLTENSNTIIITAFAQKYEYNGLDRDQSFGVTVCLRQCHSLVEMGKMPSKCIFSLHNLYIAR